MRVASSRLDIVNETDTLVQKTQQQACLLYTSPSPRD